jgi:hypothetical protein
MIIALVRWRLNLSGCLDWTDIVLEHFIARLAALNIDAPTTILACPEHVCGMPKSF